MKSVLQPLVLSAERLFFWLGEPRAVCPRKARVLDTSEVLS